MYNTAHFDTFLQIYKYSNGLDSKINDVNIKNIKNVTDVMDNLEDY